MCEKTDLDKMGIFTQRKNKKQVCKPGSVPFRKRKGFYHLSKPAVTGWL